MFPCKSYVLTGFRALTLGLPLVLTSSYFAAAQTPPDQIRFQLYPNKQFISCLAASPYITPKVNVLVQRGELNDKLTIALSGFKPGLKFDLFTVENSPQLANGSPDPKFKNFGLAWYQSDLEAKSNPTQTTIQTILLDQIFGFDPKVNLKPTKTLHVGFWFNNPADAAACGFKGPPTPFNGDNKAGPQAFTSRPDPRTRLGPLCTNPNTSTNPPSCNP